MASNASLLRTLSVEFNYVLNHQNRYQFLSLKHHVNQRKRSSLKASKIPLTVSHAQRALQTAMVPVTTVQANLLTNRAILELVLLLMLAVIDALPRLPQDAQVAPLKLDAI